MPKKKYIVELTTKEHSYLDELSMNPKVSAQRRRHANMLLAVDRGPQGPAMKDADVAKAFRCWARTVERLRRNAWSTDWSHVCSTVIAGLPGSRLLMGRLKPT